MKEPIYVKKVEMLGSERMAKQAGLRTACCSCRAVKHPQLGKMCTMVVRRQVCTQKVARIRNRKSCEQGEVSAHLLCLSSRVIKAPERSSPLRPFSRAWVLGGGVPAPHLPEPSSLCWNWALGKTAHFARITHRHTTPGILARRPTTGSGGRLNTHSHTYTETEDRQQHYGQKKVQLVRLCEAAKGVIPYLSLKGNCRGTNTVGCQCESPKPIVQLPPRTQSP